MVHTKLIWKKHCRIKFGDYAEFHNDPDSIHTLAPWNHPEIIVGTTGNFNGTVNLFLVTNQIPKRRELTRFPMHDSIINIVNEKGQENKAWDLR